MSDATRPLPPKKDVALALLEWSESVFVHLDPRRPRVIVPRVFASNPQLVLQIGMNMEIAIPDLKVDDEGISCTLSFSRSPFWCRLPWHAIWALVDEKQRGMVWPDDIPPEVPLPLQGGAAQRREKPAKRPRPRLAAVRSEAEPERGPSDDVPADGGSAAEARPAERPRPRLTAVGEPASAGPEDAPATPPPAEGEGGEPRPGSAGRPGSASAGGKPKRELPPYLRVIK